MPDHVHLLVSWRPSGAASDLLRHIKSRSSLWVNETFSGPKVNNQKEHHEKRSYEQELAALLDAHGIEYDLRYLFD